MNLPPDLLHLRQILLTRQWRLTTAESCTGGLLAAACTELPGASEWLERGFVCYSNQSKTEMLGVPADLIALHGAVSEAVAHAMARGALTHANAEVAVAITGVAGPDGGSEEKPVGTVWLGFAWPGHVVTEVRHFTGIRAEIRIASRDYAVQRLLELLGSSC